MLQNTSQTRPTLAPALVLVAFGEKLYKSIQIFQILFERLQRQTSQTSQTSPTSPTLAPALVLVAFGEKLYKSIQIFQILFERPQRQTSQTSQTRPTSPTRPTLRWRGD